MSPSEAQAEILRQGEALAAHIEQALANQEEVLQALLTDLADLINEAIKGQQKTLARPVDALRKAINSAIEGRNPEINAILDSINAIIMSGVASQGELLNTLTDSGGVPVTVLMWSRQDNIVWTNTHYGNPANVVPIPTDAKLVDLRTFLSVPEYEAWLIQQPFGQNQKIITADPELGMIYPDSAGIVLPPEGEPQPPPPPEPPLPEEPPGEPPGEPTANCGYVYPADVPPMPANYQEPTGVGGVLVYPLSQVQWASRDPFDTRVGYWLVIGPCDQPNSVAKEPFAFLSSLQTNPPDQLEHATALYEIVLSRQWDLPAKTRLCGSSLAYGPFSTEGNADQFRSVIDKQGPVMVRWRKYNGEPWGEIYESCRQQEQPATPQPGECCPEFPVDLDQPLAMVWSNVADPWKERMRAFLGPSAELIIDRQLSRGDLLPAEPEPITPPAVLPIGRNPAEGLEEVIQELASIEATYAVSGQTLNLLTPLS